MAKIELKDFTGVQQGNFFYYDKDRDKICKFDLAVCRRSGLIDTYNTKEDCFKYTFYSPKPVFTTREEAEQYAIKCKEDAEKEKAKQEIRKKRHDELVDEYFDKKGRLKAGDIVRIIKKNFYDKQQYAYIARKINPAPEPFQYYQRALAMLRKGYVEYCIGDNITGRCYFKNIDYVEVKDTGKKDYDGKDEYRITLYRGNVQIFSTSCRDLVIPLRLIFTDYGYEGAYYGWNNNADKMNTLPNGNE